MKLSKKVLVALKDLEQNYINEELCIDNEYVSRIDSAEGKYHEIYKNIMVEFKNLFICWHSDFNILIDFMNYKRRYDSEEYADLHYNADQSRSLIKLISQYEN